MRGEGLEEEERKGRRKGRGRSEGEKRGGGTDLQGQD